MDAYNEFLSSASFGREPRKKCPNTAGGMGCLLSSGDGMGYMTLRTYTYIPVAVHDEVCSSDQHMPDILSPCRLPLSRGVSSTFERLKGLDSPSGSDVLTSCYLVPLMDDLTLRGRSLRSACASDV